MLCATNPFYPVFKYVFFADKERIAERFITEEGFGNGLVYADRDEFLSAEFLNEYYMSRLLSITPDAKRTCFDGEE